MLCIAFLAISVPAFAQEGTPSAASTNSAKTIGPDSIGVDYELPYPGILPDNPLYILKAIRDRIVLFLISDIVKKSEFELLQADKRLNAAYYLSKKGKEKYPLAESTVSKAENYLESAISDTYKAKAQGKHVSDLPNRLYTASLKHTDVINSLAENIQGDIEKKLEREAKRAADLAKRADQLRTK